MQSEKRNDMFSVNVVLEPKIHKPALELLARQLQHSDMRASAFPMNISIDVCDGNITTYTNVCA